MKVKNNIAYNKQEPENVPTHLARLQIRKLHFLLFANSFTTGERERLKKALTKTNFLPHAGNVTFKRNET
jgi:hypothetical protein